MKVEKQLFGWEADQAEKQKERKNLKFLTSKGWKITKSEFGVYVKHTEHGMTTVDGALEMEAGNV